MEEIQSIRGRFASVQVRPTALSEADVPDCVKRLAAALARIHGETQIKNEKKGRHIYMASPAVLLTDGRKELSSRHLSVNADRYFGLGRFARIKGTYNNDNSGLCHKTNNKYLVSALLSMPPLSKRGIPDAKTGVRISTRARHLVDDGRGNMIPDHPGETIPVTDLFPGHPAYDYLVGRRYDLKTLWAQFRCSYCLTEAPMSREMERFYRRMPGDFRDTPQGRIIFYADIQGVQKSWQARIIDKVEHERLHYYWHPYKQQWVLVRMKLGDTWTLLPEFRDHPDFQWKPSKYRLALDSYRNEVVMGVDAAVAWNRICRPGRKRICILSEGPLDAGRFGPPALAILGKYLSEFQAKIICREFDIVVWVGDNDKAGREGTQNVREQLAGKVKLHVVTVPEPSKDPGELDHAVAWGLVKPYFDIP